MPERITFASLLSAPSRETVEFNQTVSFCNWDTNDLLAWVTCLSTMAILLFPTPSMRLVEWKDHDPSTSSEASTFDLLAHRVYPAPLGVLETPFYPAHDRRKKHSETLGKERCPWWSPIVCEKLMVENWMTHVQALSGNNSQMSAWIVASVVAHHS